MRTDYLLNGKYRLIRKLGEGGFSEVYEAEHVTLGKRVAVKLLARGGDAKRFRSEARSLARLEHPHIVHVMDFGEDDYGVAYFVMEYVKGKTLEQIIKEQFPLSLSFLRTIFQQLTHALFYIHERGCIHRDLKPANILIEYDADEQPQIKIFDFGIAKNRAEDDEELVNLTSPGLTFGTPYYMSPEQIKGDASLDHRTDIYTLGIILYEVLVGTPPFKAKSRIELMDKHLYEAPPLITDSRCSEAMQLCFEHLVAKDPDDRPRTMLEVWKELEPAFDACVSLDELTLSAALRVMPVLQSADSDFEGDSFDEESQEIPILSLPNLADSSSSEGESSSPYLSVSGENYAFDSELSSDSEVALSSDTDELPTVATALPEGIELAAPTVLGESPTPTVLGESPTDTELPSFALEEVPPTYPDVPPWSSEVFAQQDGSQMGSLTNDVPAWAPHQSAFQQGEGQANVPLVSWNPNEDDTGSIPSQPESPISFHLPFDLLPDLSAMKGDDDDDERDDLLRKKMSVETPLVDSPERAARVALLEFERGIHLGAEELFVEAAQAFRRAIALEPDNADFHYNLGLALANQKNYVEAEQVFRRAIELFPENHLYIYNLALTLSKQGRLQEAEQLLRLAIQLAPQKAEYYNQLGIVLGRQKRFSEAEVAFERAIQLNPREVSFFYNLGTTFINEQNFQKAEEVFRRAIELAPDDPMLFILLGNTLNALGRTEEAHAAHTQAHRLHSQQRKI